MPVQPETHEDTVLYTRRNIYGDDDITLRMVDGSSLNIWGEAYINGTLLDSFSINVKNYGAVGDNITDDTSAIQTAINAAVLTGGDLVFPAGKYKITAPLTVTASKGLCIRGARSGLAGSINSSTGAWLTHTGTPMGAMIVFAGCSNTIWEGVGFFGSNTADGILITSDNNPVCTNMTFRDFHMYQLGTGIYINNGGGVTQSDQMLFESVRMNEISQYGVRTNSSNVTGVKFLRCTVSMSTSDTDTCCFFLQRGSLFDIDTCVGSRGQDFVRVEGPLVHNLTINSCQSEGSVHVSRAFLRLGNTADSGNTDTTIMRGCCPDNPIVLSGTSRRIISDGNFWNTGAHITIDGTGCRYYSYGEFIDPAKVTISVPGAGSQIRRIGLDINGIPTTGTHYVGEILLETGPNTNNAAGYVCSVAGTPGTWKPFGLHSQGGVTPGIITGTGCTAMSVTGNQFTGLIAFTIPAGFAVDGTAVGITYNVTYGFFPRVLICPTNAATVAAQPFISLMAAGQFNISFHAPPAGATAMAFSYQINV